MWPAIRTSHSFFAKKPNTIFLPATKKYVTSNAKNKNYFRQTDTTSWKIQTCYILTLQKLLRFTFGVAQALRTKSHEKMNFWKDYHWQNKNKQLLKIQYRLYFIEFLGNSILYRFWLFSNDPTRESGYFAMCIWPKRNYGLIFYFTIENSNHTSSLNLPIAQRQSRRL